MLCGDVIGGGVVGVMSFAYSCFFFDLFLFVFTIQILKSEMYFSEIELNWIKFESDLITITPNGTLQSTNVTNSVISFTILSLSIHPFLLLF